LKKRKAQLQYPRFQAQGWPIGSGIVESGNKLVVEARLKGAGMHWAEAHVNPMLAIRNILCSGRWKEEWPKNRSAPAQTNPPTTQICTSNPSSPSTYYLSRSRPARRFWKHFLPTSRARTYFTQTQK